MTTPGPPRAGVALVTGADGFVGRHVVAALRAEGTPVRAVVLPGQDARVLEALGADVVRADLTVERSLPALFDGSVERVFHVAAVCNLSTPYAALRPVNVDGVERITRLALEAGVASFLHVSSTSVYGRSRGRPFTEDSPREPADDYGRSKRDGEDVVWSRVGEGLPAVVVRPCTVYGPGCTDGAGKAFSRATSIAAIPGSGRARLSNVRVEDVAAAAVFLSRRGDAVGEAYNVADDSHPTVEEALVLAARAFGTRVPWLHVPLAVLGVVARVQGWSAARRGRIPDLESDALAYLGDDYLVDNAKLRATGFRLRYADFPRSMQELGSSPDGSAGLAEVGRVGAVAAHDGRGEEASAASPTVRSGAGASRRTEAAA